MEIDAGHIPTITVLNKVDQFPDPQAATQTLTGFPGPIVAISALIGQGIPELLSTVSRELFEVYVPVRVKLPYQQGNLISIFHDQGKVTRVEHVRGGVWIEGNLPVRLLARFQPFIKNDSPDTSEEVGETIET